MTVFRYRALSADGRKVSGTVEAATSREANQALRDKGMHVTSIAASGGAAASPFERVRARGGENAYLFTSHMRRLLRARLPLVEALDATKTELARTSFAPVVSRVRDKVAGGASLAEALSQEKGAFDELYVAMIQAAQASGTLAAAFDNIHQYESRRREFQRKLTSALAYPLVLVVVSILVVMFLVAAVVPKIAATLVAAKVELPLVTQALVLVGSVAERYWMVAVAALLLVGFSPRIMGLFTAGRALRDRALVDAVVLRRFARPAMVARFSRTFSALLVTGLRVADALEIAGRVSGNSIFEKSISQARSRIVAGGDLEGALSESKAFPGYALQIVGIGERTGTLAQSFEEIAKAEEEDLETLTGRLMTFLEPALIVVMAGVVGFIVASVLLPILSLSTMSGG